VLQLEKFVGTMSRLSHGNDACVSNG